MVYVGDSDVSMVKDLQRFGMNVQHRRWQRSSACLP